MKLLKAPYLFISLAVTLKNCFILILFLKLVFNFAFFLKIDFLQERKVCRGKVVPVETGYEIHSTFVI